MRTRDLDNASSPSLHAPSFSKEGLVALSWKNDKQTPGDSIYNIAAAHPDSPPPAHETKPAVQDRKLSLDLGQVLNLKNAEGQVSLTITIKHPATGALLNVEKLPPGVDIEYDQKLGAIILYGKAEDIEAAIKAIQLDLFLQQHAADLILFIKVNTELNEGMMKLHVRESDAGALKLHVFRSSGDATIQEIGQKLFVDSRPIEQLYLREDQDTHDTQEVLPIELRPSSGISGIISDAQKQSLLGSGSLGNSDTAPPTPEQPPVPTEPLPPLPIPETPPPDGGGSGGGGGTTPPPVTTIPVLTDFASTHTVIENDAATVLDNAVTLTDTSVTSYDGGSIVVSSGGMAEDQLSLASDALGSGALRLNSGNVQYSSDGISWTVIGTVTNSGTNGSNLTIVFNSNATPTMAESVIEHITYQNTSDNPAANHTISITVNNGTAGGTSNVETMVVSVTPVNDAPVLVNAISDQAALAGGSFNFTFAASAFDDVDSTLTYSATLSDGSPLPAWLTFDDATRSFSGSPAFGDIGTISVKVTASDGTLSTDDTFDIVVSNDLSVSNLNQTDTYIEDATKDLGNVVIATPAATVTVTLSLTSPGLGALSTATSGAVTSTYDATTGVWEATGALADVNTLLAGVQFTPASNSTTSASITVNVTDSLDTATGTITLNATSVNDAPVATADSYTTTEDTPLTINAASGVLSNDSDPSDTPANTLNATLISGVSHGTLTLNSDGSFTYTPTLDYTGTDSFTYRVDDNGGTSNGGVNQGNTVTVTLTIGDIDDAPVNTVPAAQTTNEDTAKVISGISVADSDSTNLTVTLSITNGTLNLNNAVAGGLTAGQITGNGTTSVTLTGTSTAINATLADSAGLTFTPTANMSGSATLTVLTSDGTLTDSDTVTISIASANDAPTALADSYTVTEDTPLTINAAGGVLANDSDPNDSPANALSATLISTTSHGSLTLNGDGSFTYTPATDYTGTDSFTYRVDDNGGTANGGTNQGNTVTVSLTVNAANDAPVNTVPGTQTLNEDSSKVISGISVADVDNATVTVTLSVTHSTLTINSGVAGGLTAGQISTNGSASVTLTGTTTAINATLADSAGVTFMPTANYTGSDTLTVLTSDGSLTDSDTVAITISSVSDAPTFSGLSSSVTYAENTVNASPQVLDSSVSFADVDPESYIGGSLSIVLSSGGAEDQLSIRNQGSGAGQIGHVGTNIYYGGVLIGTVTSDGENGSDLIINFNASSTPAAVKALVENITYLNTSDTPAASRDAMFTISDGTNSVSQTITINVTQQVDTFVLTSSGDHFVGGTENDTFQGSGANLDQLADTLMGGAGSDMLSITGGSAVFDTNTFTDLGGIEEFIFSNNAAHDITVLDAYFSTTGFNGTTLKMTANATSTVGVNFDASAVAASHTLSITGGNGDDTLLGGAGNDTIYSNGGDDSIDGGAGDDTVTASISNINPNDSINGGAGDDWLTLNGGAINLNTTTFSNIGGFERFFFDAENNHSLTLGNSYYATAGFSGGIVYLTSSAATGNIFLDADAITTSTNKVSATANGGNDTLLGGAGNDTLAAGNGANRLVGGGGADSLSGGSGIDRFAYTAVSESTVANQDTISGFISGTDLLDFSVLGLDYLHNNAFTNAPNQIRWDVSGSNAIVQIDTSGDGTADSQITLLGVASLQVTDFTGVNIVSTTFTLTSSNDNFIGGASTDQFQGASTNLATTDTIRGGAGNDILQITTGALTLNTTTYSNLWGVEEFQLNSVGAHSLTIGNAYFSTTGFVGNNLVVSTTSTTGITVTASGVSTATKTVNITGGAGADALTGGAGNDTISGAAGNDTITGGAGNDSLDGGAGNDSFSYTMANLTTADTIAGGAGTDTLTISSGTMTMTPGTTYINISGIETISLTSNAAHSVTVTEGYYSSIGFSGTNLAVTTTSTTGITVDGTALTSGSFTMSATGGAGNDTFTGGTGADTMTAGAGNDSLTGGAGNDRFSFITTNLNSSDTIIGGAGTDMLYISSGTLNLDPTTLTNMSGIESFYFNNAASHVITLTDSYYTSMGMSGSTVVVSTASSATGITVNASAVTGASYILNATGSSGNDTFRGGAGNDIFNSSTGNDSVDGGAGNDTINFSSANYVTGADTLGGGAGMDSLVVTGGTTVFTLNTTTMLNFTGIETVTVNRNAAHTVTVDDTYFTTTGFIGNIFTFGTTSSTGSNLNASAVTNTAKSVAFTSGSGNDTIVAGAGNDTINSSTGTDNVNAGAGNDVFLSSGSNYTSADTIAGGAGMDTMQTNAGTLSLNTSTFTNFTGIETFTLNNNASHSLTFYDAYFSTAGFAGNTITITSTSTTAFTVNAANVTTSTNLMNVTGFSANDVFTGGAGNDTLNGAAGNDTIVGGAGDDSILGDVGTDNLTGGLGVDNITGGAGNDNYIYTLVTDSGIGLGNRDIITDFTTGDKISLSAFAGTFTFRAGGLGEANFTGSVAQVAYAQDGSGHTIVYVDSNGDGITNFEVQLDGNLALAATDFTL